MDSEKMDSEKMDSEKMDSEKMDSEKMDSEKMDSEKIDFGKMDKYLLKHILKYMGRCYELATLRRVCRLWNWAIEEVFKELTVVTLFQSGSRPNMEELEALSRNRKPDGRKIYEYKAVSRISNSDRDKQVEFALVSVLDLFKIPFTYTRLWLFSCYYKRNGSYAKHPLRIYIFPGGYVNLSANQYAGSVKLTCNFWIDNFRIDSGGIWCYSAISMFSSVHDRVSIKFYNSHDSRWYFP